MAWWEFTGTVPPAGGSVLSFTSGSLQTALDSLTTGQTLRLDTDGVFTENVDVVLPDNVSVLPGPGRRPRLNGSMRLRGGTGVRFYGLDVTWTSADPSGHMIKLDAGEIDWGHCEIYGAACYTLLRPGQTLVNSRMHHFYCHDNPGVAGHDGNQDHGVYCDVDALDANIEIDRFLIEEMPRGRNIKVGGPSGTSPDFGGIHIHHGTLRTGYGPSNGQVSNGATNTLWERLLLLDSGSSTNLTDGSGSGGGNVYRDCLGDRAAVGEDTANFSDGGGNTGGLSTAYLSDYTARGSAGYGHLAAMPGQPAPVGSAKIRLVADETALPAGARVVLVEDTLVVPQTAVTVRLVADETLLPGGARVRLVQDLTEIPSASSEPADLYRAEAGQWRPAQLQLAYQGQWVTEIPVGGFTAGFGPGF